MYHYAGNNPVKYTDPDGRSPLSCVKAFGKGAWDAAVSDVKAVGNAIAHPKETVKNMYESAKAEVSAIIDDPLGYAGDKIDGAVQDFKDFMDSSAEEKAYTLGGLTEKVAVSYAGAKAASAVASKVTGAAKVSSAAQKGSAAGACFIAGTLISTADGLKPIEQIIIGDFVYSYNEAANEIELNEVLNTFVHEEYELIILRINDFKIVTTSVHPFWTEEHGWISAGELVAGDTLQTKNRESYKITSIEIEVSETPVTVYNIEVDKAHTYFVGDYEILVHNKAAKNPHANTHHGRISGKLSLLDMKKSPPVHPDYKPPKNWDGKKVRTGKGSGWPAKNGDVWEPTDHNGTHAPHWDVQHRNGTHTPVYPE